MCCQNSGCFRVDEKNAVASAARKSDEHGRT